MTPITFKVTDNSVNRKGLIIDTIGIETENFNNNNILLYNHDLQYPIGLANYYSNGLEGFADLYFDEEDDFAMKIKRKVEKGQLKTASISIIFNKKEIYLNSEGIPVIPRSELREISIAPIPANINAVVQFSAEESNIKIESENIVSLNDNSEYDSILTLSAELSKDITEELNKLFKTNKTNKNKNEVDMIDLAKFNVETEDELVLKLNTLETSLSEKETELLNFNSKIQENETSIIELNSKNETLAQTVIELNSKLDLFENKEKENLIELAITEGKFNENQKEYLIKLSATNFDLVKGMIENATTIQKPNLNLNNIKKEVSDFNWTIDDWRKNNPEKLKDIFRNDKVEYERILNNSVKQ